jgi:adhesin transport system outer membrane protein
MIVRKINFSVTVTISALLIGFSTFASAQAISNFEQAITETVIENPEVKATWYDFEAAREQQRVASGNYRPRLDLTGEVGRERAETPSSAYQSYDRDSANITLTQMLFDGFETKNEVERLGYAKLSKFYEIKQASERSALETGQSYLDVLRYQGLVVLAKENYVNHKTIFDDIKQRADAGISRRVDLEQASGRLALSESNLLTEVTNLHDVSVRFQRLTGRLPAQTLDAVVLPTEFIADNTQGVLDRAYVTSPVINSAIENLRAAQSEVKVANAAYMPKFDLRLRKQLDHNTEGVLGRYDEEAIELVMTYNLYNGGSDSARKRQLYQQMNSARELRQKACRDVRQQLAIAYNDIQSLEEQIGYLDRNRKAIASARVAYRKQFDIGQRTLLDLLDTENEYFEVQRAYRNATQDLMLAQVRTLSGMGILLDSLGLSGREAQALEYIDTQRPEDADVGGRCPAGAPVAMQINKEALLASVLAEANFNDSKSITIETIDIAGESTERVKIDVSVGFAYKSTALSAESVPALADAAMLLRKFPAADAIVAGYTDSVAPQDYNVKLSQQRAEAVREALIDDYGIDPSRLAAIGYGKDSPIADNETAAGRAKNRRVELIMDIDEADTYIQEPIEGVSFESLDTGLDDIDNSSFESLDEAMADESADAIEMMAETSEASEQLVDDVAAEPLSAGAVETLTLEASGEDTGQIEEISLEAMVDEPVMSEMAEKSMAEIIESPSQIEEITFEDVDESTPIIDAVEPEPLSAAEISDSAAEAAGIKFEYLAE